MKQYAEVVVHAPVSRRMDQGRPASSARTDSDVSSPLGGTFHYTIPLELVEQVVPGSLVSVPFGERILQGVVIALRDTSPVAETKSLAGLVMSEPVLLPAQLALACWLSEATLSPLIDTVRLFVPPGLIPAAVPVLERVPEAALPSDLTEEQNALLTRLERGPLRWQYARRHYPAWTQPKTLKPLLDAGVVRRHRVILRRTPRPKADRRLRLLVDSETIKRFLPLLGRASKQADVLAWLATGTDPLPTLAQVCQDVGCSEGPVKELADRGWVEITQRRELLALAVSSEEVDALSQGKLARSPSQMQVLTTLAEARLPLTPKDLAELSGVSLSTMKQVEKRGYIHRMVEEPQVILNLSPEETRQRIVELRGGQKHQAVLEALLGAGGSAWVGRIYAETDANTDVLRSLEAVGLIQTEQAEVMRDPLAGQTFSLESPPQLTQDQAAAWGEIEVGMAAQGEDPPVYLLYGVTGSGKTEIYLRALAETLAQGFQALVLVPEIALTPQTVRRFAARFPGRIALLHGSLSPGERYDQWRRLKAGEFDVVIGSRSALFARLARLGLIVLDEEHEPAYKQERSPRYHARETALQLARFTGATVILGSATPSLESYYRAQQGEYHLLKLPRRVLAPMSSSRGESITLTSELPPVRVVDMRQELHAGNRHIFSRALQDALERTLAAGEQAILFLNRRGAATFVLCRDCGYVHTCRRCDAPLIQHLGTDDLDGTKPAAPRSSVLICHHCGRRYPPPTTCPQCGNHRIRYFGAGTQRVEEAVQAMFPEARTLRWDRDVTGQRGMHERILDRFMQREADILIGTQMVAKGLDLPWVTLVGAIAADTGLFLPDFRAAERTFQLLTQVVGRAGRTQRGGQAIIQTYNPQVYPIQSAAAHDYDQFYQDEVAFRREQAYPPFRRLARLLTRGNSELAVRRDAEMVARRLREELNRRGESRFALIGPAPCFFARVRGRYRWHIVLRSVDPAALLRDFPLPRGWWVDIDPISLL